MASVVKFQDIQRLASIALEAVEERNDERAAHALRNLLFMLKYHDVEEADLPVALP